MDKLSSTIETKLAPFRKGLMGTQFKLDNDMCSYMLINGFFLGVFVILNLTLNYVLFYASWAQWYAFFSAAALFFLYLRPTSEEKLHVQGYLTNYNGYVQFKPKHIHRPATVEEIVSILSSANQSNTPLRVAGGLTSFNDITSTKSSIILMDSFKQILKVDKESKTVTVQAGVRLGELATTLWKEGLSLPSVGWFNMQTVGGAMQSGSHGSSIKLGNFASRVTEFEIVTPSGEVLKASPSNNKDLFEAGRVGLGVLGVVTTVTLQCEPAFYLQKVSQLAPVDDLVNGLNERLENNDYFSFWWIPHTAMANAIVLNKTDKPETNIPFPKKVALQIVFSLVARLVLTLTTVLEVINTQLMTILLNIFQRQESVERSSEALNDHFAEIFPKWTQSEYFVSKDDAPAVMKELQQTLKSGGWKLNFPVRVSFVGSDNSWLSESAERNSAIFTIGMFGKTSTWSEFVTKLDSIMKRYDGRPNWTTTHKLKREQFEQLYPRFNDFNTLRQKYDPNGILLNNYLKSVFAA